MTASSIAALKLVSCWNVDRIWAH